MVKLKVRAPKGVPFLLDDGFQATVVEVFAPPERSGYYFTIARGERNRVYPIMWRMPVDDVQAGATWTRVGEASHDGAEFKALLKRIMGVLQGMRSSEFDRGLYDEFLFK